MSRSQLVAISDKVIRAIAYRGKIRDGGTRPALCFYIPRSGMTGIDWGGRLRARWNEVCKVKGKVIRSIALSLNTGEAISAELFNRVAHEMGCNILKQVKGEK